MSPNRNGSVVYPDCALYEVGGNIGKLEVAAAFSLTFACLSAR